MTTNNGQFDKRRGAALILVIVVTVLLAVVGVMFLMVSRLSEMETSTLANSRDLDAGVEAVVAQINDVLVTNPDNPVNYDSLPWLCSLEPIWAGDNGTPTNPTDDLYTWPQITDLLLSRNPQASIRYLYNQRFSGIRWIDPDYTDNAGHATEGWSDNSAPEYRWDKWQVSASNVRAKVIEQKDRMDIIAINGTTVPATWDTAVDVRSYGARADADGDGVADSRWVQIPGLTSTKGKPLFAAVRIIDNGAMLNLNGAHCFYQEPHDTSNPLFEDASSDPISFFEKPWFASDLDYDDPTPDNFRDRYNMIDFDKAKAYLYHKNFETGSGRYLTEINYLPFLRGNDLSGDFFGGSAGDNWIDLMLARGFYELDTSNNIIPFSFSPQESQDAFLRSDNPANGYHFFDMADELEIRNRYMLTSKTEARCERADVANFTLDSGGGVYAALQIPIDDGTHTYGSGVLPNLNRWKIRVNPANFDAWSGAFNGTLYGQPTDYSYRYDRRHVCTFYSMDRVLRKGTPPSMVAVRLIADGWTTEQIERINPSLYWYPELYKNLFDDLGLTPAQILNVQNVFLSVGPVTTDIRVPVKAGGQWYYTNSTETRRRIIQLLYAFREYYIEVMGDSVPTAAKKSAQLVANIIDYSDDNSIVATSSDHQGPFYATLYGAQANVDCTFITEDIIEDMIDEVSGGVLPDGSIDFGLTETVFGYERQPFISEVYARRDPGSGALLEFAIELLNPYAVDIPLYRADSSYVQNDDAWRIRVADGSAIDHAIGNNTPKLVPKYDETNKSPGRYVIRDDNTVALAAGPLVTPTFELSQLNQMNSLPNGNYEIQLLRPAPAKSGVPFIIVDRVSSDDVKDILSAHNRNAIKREDGNWKFIFDDYELEEEDAVPSTYTHTLGQANNAAISGLPDGFQIAVADDEKSISRWHELETLSWFGNIGDSGDPNEVMTKQLRNAGGGSYFNLETDSVLDYVCLMNRPDDGTLPGRININTAPLHVIAAAIPPGLADPNAPDPGEVAAYSALDMAKDIINNRPYSDVSDLLTKVSKFKQYTTGTWAGENVGQQSIEDDIEEEHWVLSNLANKFTVRSDVFTAYILIRLGEDGPQRRMIAIFDRSNVWEPGDVPKLVALHPVPDPR